MSVPISTKGGWIPALTRDVLLATRPWSIPASLVPCVLSALLSFRLTSSSPLLSSPLPSSPPLSSPPLSSPPLSSPLLSSLLSSLALSSPLLSSLLSVAAGVFAHLGANCANTYYDFKQGLDKKESADDRALVDDKVSPATVWRLMVACFSVSVLCALPIVLTLGSSVAVLAAVGLALAFFYTAKPISLKHLGLGDVTIGVCFGPLLMVGVSQATTLQAGLYDPVVLAFSVPIALLTINILHANNTRDILSDRKAGAVTLANMVGFRASFGLYCTFLVAAYVSTAVALTWYIDGAQEGQVRAQLCYLYELVTRNKIDLIASVESMLLVLKPECGDEGTVCQAPQPVGAAVKLLGSLTLLCVITLPWAVELVRRFKVKALRELPQSTAQFNLLYGAALLGGILPTQTLARAALGLLFYLGGVNNIIMWLHSRLLVTQKLSKVLPTSLAHAIGPLLCGSASVMQMAASACFILGIHARLMAVILIVFLLPVTAIVHDFWNADYRDGDQVVIVQEDRSATPQAVTTERGKTTPRRGRRPSAANMKHSVAARDIGDEPAAEKTLSSNNVPVVSVTSHIPTFLTDFDNEFVHFFKNIIGFGGLLAYILWAS